MKWIGAMTRGLVHIDQALHVAVHVAGRHAMLSNYRCRDLVVGDLRTFLKDVRG